MQRMIALYIGVKKMKIQLKRILKTVVISAILSSAASHAQNTQWQIWVGSEPEPRTGGLMQPQVLQQPAPVVQAAAVVESIQAQQNQRILWGAQRGYLTDSEYRRLTQMQQNIEHNRRIAYADGYFVAQEQQYVYGQLNMLSAEIDSLILNGNFALPYYQQYSTPIPVWVLNTGWVNGRYEIRSESHHNRAYRPAPQPPVVQPTQQQPQDHHHRRNRLRDLLDPMGVFR
jgi:hypothetical protein